MSNCTIINSDQAGRDGLSNYELAIRTGAFSGTEAEYIEWIKGKKGDPGESGVINNASAMTLPPESPASANIEDLGGQKILVLGIPKGETGPQGGRGEPGVNGVNGSDGVSSFKSTVFIRTNSTPNTPTGGSYAQPVPSGWNDGIPAGEEQIWISTRIFSSNGNPPQQESWTTPRPVSDTSVLDYEVSDVEIPGNPTDNPENWRDASTGSPSDIWLAIRTKNNGVWSSWTVLKIKGESGADGVNGSAGLIPEIRYAVNGSFSTPPPISESDRDPYGWSVLVPSASVGQYIWVTTALINPETDQLANLWNNPSRFTGQPGEPGEKGNSGASIIIRGDWKEDEQYIGTTELVHMVKYDGKGYLSRTDAGEIPIGTEPIDTDYWNEFTEDIDSLLVDFLVAYSAYIKDLIVASLRTGVSGERIEVIEGENKFKFHKEEDINPSLEIGTFEIELKTPVPQPDPQPTVTVAGLINNSQNAVVPKTLISDEGIIVNQNDPKLSAFTLPITSGTISTRFVLYAGAIFLGPGPLSQDKVAAALESVYIHSPIRVWGEDTNGDGEMKYGFTGIHNGMEYINGVAIGPV